MSVISLPLVAYLNLWQDARLKPGGEYFVVMYVVNDIINVDV